MITSHKGQILALKKNVIPISKNTTFHADFNNKLYGLNQGMQVPHYGYTRSLNFNGSTDYVQIDGSVDNLQTPTALTVEAWIYYKGGDGRIVQKDGPTVIRCWEMGVYGGSFRMEMWHSDGTSILLTGSPISTNTWTHVAITFDGTTINMYQNGSYVNSGTFTGDIKTSIFTPILIGGYWYGEYFNGRVSDVRIWGYARTPKQISDSMNKEFNGDEKGLVGYWKLNDETEDIVYDSSLNTNIGEFVGSPTWEEGRTIATLRPFDGKFGYAIAIEEPTTNLISNFQSSLNTDGSGAVVTYDPITHEHTVDLTNWTGAGYGYIRFDGGPCTLSAPYSFGARLKYSSLKSTQLPDYRMGTYSNNNYADPIAVEGERTIVNNEVFSVSGNLFIDYNFIPAQHAGHIFIFSEPQIEQKEFATSFTEGSRESGALWYPKDIINFSSFTLSTWFNIPYMYRDSGANTGRQGSWYNPIIEIVSTNSTAPWNGIGLLAGPEPAPYNRLLSVYSNGGQSDPGLTQIQDNTWYHVVLTYDGTTFKIYLNGKLEVSYVKSTPTIGDDFVLMVGGGYMGAPNCLISDLRIDDVVVSEDEILAWYQSDTPFYNYLDYSEVAY